MHLLFKANQPNEKDDPKGKSRPPRDIVVIPHERDSGRKIHRIPIDEFYNMVVDLIELPLDFCAWEQRNVYVLFVTAIARRFILTLTPLVQLTHRFTTLFIL